MVNEKYVLSIEDQKNEVSAKMYGCKIEDYELFKKAKTEASVHNFFMILFACCLYFVFGFFTALAILRNMGYI